MIQGVILAGGLGTRLKPLTEQVPKPLVRVGGRPFLEHQLELLKSYRVTDILLLVSYRGWMIEEHFGNGTRFGLRIDYAQEETPRGTGGALKNAEKKLQEEFLLLNGDTFLPIDYRDLVERYRQRRPLGLVVANENRLPGLANNLGVDPEGRVTAYNKREPAGLTHVDAGVAVLSRGILALIPPRRVCSLEEEIYPRLIERGELWAFPTRERFYDIGSLAGLEAFAEVVA